MIGMRIKALMLRLGFPEHKCQSLVRTGTRTADQIGSPTELNEVSKSDSTQHFCERCKELDLPGMLEMDTQPLCVGLLEEFDDPLCQLCDTINHFVKQNCDHGKLSVIRGNHQRVYAQSSPWWYSLNSYGLRRHVWRIILTLDQRPNLQNLGQSMPDEDSARLVLTELEIDPMRTEGASVSIPARRSIFPYLDLALVRAWLDDCHHRHGSWIDDQAFQVSSTTQSLFSNGFRLIDVFEGKLVEEFHPCEYIALSYVWGQAASFALSTNKDNVLSLCQPSSLHKPYDEHGVSRRLPRTIVDAMSLARSIGQRYLWVDSLCIVQDDPEEKRRLIHGMDSVYENASLTLVALSGVDADAGLAGISPRGNEKDNRGRQYLFHETYGACCIGIGRVSLIEHIRSSHWNTRGWTYQEQVLSPRKLYFTSGEVFYDCYCQQLREGYALERLRRPSIWNANVWRGIGLNRDPLKYAEFMLSVRQISTPETQRSSDIQTRDVQFQRIVSLYTRRQLKNSGDILHALTGVYNRFYACSDMRGIDIDALQGIPMRCFSRALLWFTQTPCSTRRYDVSGTEPSSWSWISWIMPVDFACEMKSRFPSSVSGIYHSGISTFSMVEEWCLTFQKGSKVHKARFSGRKFYDKVESSIHAHEIGIKEFMKSLPLEIYDNTRALPELAVPGLLDFRALYIPAPVTEAYPKWSQKTGREWHLSFEGTEIYDKTLGCIAIALFDRDEKTVDGFVLLLSDYSFMGICVKEIEHCFERVGVCIFTNSRKDWECVMEKGLLKMYWKRIMLR